MSSIDKLSIRGIRSFDPQSQNIIEFYTPLTIIVGPNGAGKTTIIECLKYATTGDLPPNSKGGAFVFDPKLAHESEVKAQVKLKFKSINGRQMMVTRSLQLSQKKTRTEMKTLESLLVTKDPSTGQQISISSRCSELDNELPLHFGVSNAILQDVIFCHQEDSNWPLSEPGILKKKFDDIFASTKYTKALDELKSIKKNSQQEQKLEFQKLEFLKLDAEKAKKIRIQLDITKESIHQAKQHVDICDQQSQILSISINDLISKIQKQTNLRNLISKKKHECDTMQSHINDLNLNISTILDVSDDDLSLLLKEYQNRISTTFISTLTDQRRILNSDLSFHNSNHSTLLTKRGLLMAEANQQAIRNKEISKFFQIFSQYEDIKPRLSDQLNINEAAINELLSSIELKSNSYQHQLESIKASSRNEESLILSKIQHHVTKQNISSEQRKMKRKQFDINNIKIEEKKSMIKALTSDLMELPLLEQHISEQDILLNAKANELTLLETKRISLEREISNMNIVLSSEQYIKLSLLKSDILNKTNSLKMLYNMNSPDTDTDITRDMISKLQNDIEHQLNILNNELKVLEDDRNHIINQQFNLQTLETQLNLKNGLVKQYKSSLFTTTPTQELVKLEQERTELRLYSKETISLYNRFITQCEQYHDCPLCHRPFHQDDYKQLIIELQDYLKQISHKENQSRLDEIEKKLKELEHLRPIFSEIERIPAIENEIKVIKGDLSRYPLLSEIESTISDIKSKIKRYEKCDINEMISLYQEIEEKKMLLECNSINIDPEYQKDSHECMHQIENIKQEISNIKALLNELKTKFHVLEGKKIEKQKFEHEIESITKENNILEEDIHIIDKESITLQNEISKLKQEKEETMKRFDELERNILKELNSFSNQKSIFIELVKSSSNVTQDLESIEKEIQSTLDNINILKEKLCSLDEQIMNQESNISQIKILERNARDNKKSREMKMMLDELLKEYKLLMNDDVDDVDYNRQLDTLKMKQESLIAERASHLGELKQLEDQTFRLGRELQNDYKNIDSLYIEQIVRVKTTEMMLQDIDTYMKVLDNAIMKYHSLKMSEINKIIRELWVNTYQGSDIDTIEIRSDTETSNNRSYHYRVVMIKGDTELDMRGRCSAGQRVLGSIIIRLALAESFGLHCGILALDEPTTNLDRSNIESLAESLCQIIKSRRKQHNFQLIIITHDEDFVRLLGRSEFADYYWRISRDENQHSIIERQSITTNMTCLL